jgi:hypothetical protein
MMHLIKARRFKFPFLMLGCFFLLACALNHDSTSTAAHRLPDDKIEFDRSKISPEGLIGPPDGLRSVRYEFCIPASKQALAEVQAIAPEIRCHLSVHGRIGCSRDQYLCLGDTHNPGWQDILRSLANLDYVQKIIESFGE